VEERIPFFSVVIPVFNRPQELEELLTSLVNQTIRDFNVLVVEDGSTLTSRHVYEKFTDRLPIEYFVKPNSGPGPSRNFGFERASGRYLVVFDSDCILPSDYFQHVQEFMNHNPVDAWGGPDRGHEKFTPLQQAMAYTMSSVLTTGGIRGGKNQAERFQPRSFNMGVSRAVFEATGGFRFDRLAEDIEWSIRMRNAGFRVALIPNAFVYHKRRATLTGFFRQVKGFGRGRVRVGRAHPGEVKITHWFPAVFTLALLILPVLWLLSYPLAAVGSMLVFVYLFAIAADAWRTTRSVTVAGLAVPSALTQLTGYGLGFLQEQLKPKGNHSGNNRLTIW
jgi:glycosyltransferase involved in cell wall biosynthesis